MRSSGRHDLWKVEGGRWKVELFEKLSRFSQFSVLVNVSN
jgi:hypothetical protein